jgi:hypothetical protein
VVCIEVCGRIGSSDGQSQNLGEMSIVDTGHNSVDKHGLTAVYVSKCEVKKCVYPCI